jgi:hypothetical protein
VSAVASPCPTVRYPFKMRGTGGGSAALLAGGALASIVAVVAVGFTGACQSTEDCCGGCTSGGSAAFALTCPWTDLQAVSATGPCATPDGGASWIAERGAVYVSGDRVGTCHVELVFATGFTYAADVDFALQPGVPCGGPQCTCPDYVAPTPGGFEVHNPSSTCVAAPEAAAPEAAPPVCPTSAYEGVACTTPEACTGCRDSTTFQCTCAALEAGEIDAATDVPQGPVWQCVDTASPCDR